MISDGVGIEARSRAELIQPMLIRYLTEFEGEWSRVMRVSLILDLLLKKMFVVCVLKLSRLL